MDDAALAKPGRPSLYNPEVYPRKAEELASRGYGLGPIADDLGVSRATVVRWKAEHPEFGIAIDVGWDHAVDAVAHSFYRAAMGYEYTTTTLTQGPRGDSTVTRTLYARPNFRTMLNYLYHRRPQEWSAAPQPPPPAPIYLNCDHWTADDWAHFRRLLEQLPVAGPQVHPAHFSRLPASVPPPAAGGEQAVDSSS